MNGSVIKYLAGVADLAALDIEAAAVTLTSKSSGEISAFYDGMYAKGLRKETGDGADFSVSINANQFKTLALMFSDDDNVLLDRSKTGLVIKSRYTNASLREWGERGDVDDLMPKNAPELIAALPADSLQSEIDAAAGFASDSQLRPALTGIRFSFDGALTLTATDGDTAFYVSTTHAKTKGKGDFIVPTEDFLRGARLVTGGNVRVYKPNNHGAVVIYNNRSVFRSVLINAPWPDLTDLMKKRPTAHFQVEAAQLRNLVSGAKALGSGPDINVVPAKGRVVFKTESDSGNFSTAVKGNLTNSLRYGVESMAKVIKLGPVLDFYVPEKAYEPTIVECGDRRCWILTRI